VPEDSNNRMHGKTFENMIKAAHGIFTYAAADRERSPGEYFDIAAEDDQDRGIPTAIKASGSATIGLSDARRFWASFDHVPYRILIGIYCQEGDTKKFTAIHELILRRKYRQALPGDITPGEITAFHEGIRAFGIGQHLAARDWAQKIKGTLKARGGAVTLNPKIDSRTQRRLQCSIHLAKLRRAVSDEDQRVHVSRFGKLPLPFPIVSGKRTFSAGR